jgi:molybdopterin/thiamine biosynthesis adenylyltransferase
LARLGVGRFSIADPDTFDVANFNRQYGATLHNLGRGKAESMAEEALQINPELDLRVSSGPITPENVADFLDGASVVLDGIDFFAFDSRRLLFREARERGLWAITAGPIGFGSAWIVFDPQGMDFDTYFDLHDGMAKIDQFAAFTCALAPAGLHWPYFDLSHVQGKAARGPASGAACQICSGIAAVEAAKVILGRKPLRAAPCYAQFDAYRGLLRRGRLLWGNRGPLQRLKRSILRRTMVRLGYGT